MEHISEDTRKARKAHKCDLCLKPIAIGETYRHALSKDGGTVWGFDTHEQCWDIARALWSWFDPDEGITSEYFEESLPEYTQEFVCPHCPNYIDGLCVHELDASMDCLDRISERLKTHRLVSEKGDDRWGFVRWIEHEIEAQTGREG